MSLVLIVSRAPGGTATAPGGTTTAPSPGVAVIPAEGPIEWMYTVEQFRNAVKLASAQKPKVLIFQINSPGGVVDYTWEMISEFKYMPGTTTVAWIRGKTNGAFSSGAIFALACDRIYMARGQAIGAAVPYELDSGGIPRDVSLKWRSAWHAQVRALCEMKNRPWPVVHALLSTAAGLYRVKTPAGYEYINYEQLRPRLRPEMTGQLDPIFKEQIEELEKVDNRSTVRRQITRRATIERQVSNEGMPEGVEVICPVGDVLTLTSEEAIRCGLCDGTADTIEEVLGATHMPEARLVTLDDPFKRSKTHMDNVVKTFVASLAAVGGSLREADGKPGFYLETHGQPAGRGGREVTVDREAEATRLAHLRKLKAQADRYPDLLSRPQARAQIDRAIAEAEAALRRQKEREREQREEERKTRQPRVMPYPLW